MPVERIPVRVYRDSRRASRAVARRIAEVVRERKAQGRPAVLGLATGHTPVEVYRELIRLHRRGLDLSHVVTFNLDEYWPFDPAAAQSYHSWMHENLFRHVNIRAENIHIPGGDVAEADIAAHCREYEQAIARAGGIDYQILGVGRSGHIGFNEPGSARDSRTRAVPLDRITRRDAASDFFGEENVPRRAVTMGVGTILEAREIGLLAFGEHKASIIRRAVEGEISPQVAASYLQTHPSAKLHLDLSAGAALTRLATPWMLGPCPWDELLKRQAVIWLARKLKKPILKLTEEDYAENGLSELLRVAEGCYRLNIEVFRAMMGTITGWPGGKEARRRVLVFSPHPDDDVICMAGTMMRFAQQGHEVHVAYMVSGYLSIFDHDVARYADFVREFNRIFALGPEQTAALEERLEGLLLSKSPGEVDVPEVRAIKSLIRRTEARDAARFCGLPEENIHFLDMPFYDTGRVQKLSLSEADVGRVGDVLEKVRPDMIFAAGDMSDPHGTHRLCLEAVAQALASRRSPGRAEPEVWLYRGAWEEWAPEHIAMAVPMSPDELQLKRYAIFRHQSQKDRAMFPGAYDSREFWQRAEDRNMGTAAVYDQLGLPEYHALEAFAPYGQRLSASAELQLEPEPEEPAGEAPSS
jgi:glucosamine-6-phosphate deaminase